MRVENLRKSKSIDDKGQCDVLDCTNQSKRAVSSKKIRSALPSLKFKKEAKRYHLCKDHYKDYKKATKTERKLETLTWN